MNRRFLLLTTATLTLTSCMSAADHQASLHSSAERELTVGVVQARIEKGMSQGDVANALGSPNIVSKDQGGADTWIYDKIATEASYSNDRGGVGGLVGGGGTPDNALILGGLTGSYNRSAGASAVTQKTLTVVIKFDKHGKVADFSYHSSKF